MSKITFKNYLISSLSFFIIFILAVVLLWDKTEYRVVLADVTLPVLNVIILLILYFAVLKSREFKEASSMAWLMILISQIFLFVMDIVWLLSDLQTGPFLGFAPILIFYSIHVILFSAGLLLLPGPKMQKIKKFRRMADIGLVMCIIFIALWILVVDRIVRYGITDTLTVYATIIFVIMEFTFCYIIIAVSLRNAGQLRNNPVSYLLLAATLQVFSTAIFGYVSLEGIYIAGGLSDLLMIGSYLLLGVAGFLKVTQKQPIKFHDYSHKVWYMRVYLNYQIPALFGILIYLLLIWTYIYKNRIFLDILLASSLVITLVIIRQVLQMEEIKRSEKIADNNLKIAEEATKKAEENLKIAEANEEKFRAIIENSIDAIVITSEDEKIAQWNTGAQRIYGYDAEEAINQDIGLIIPPEVIETYKNGLRRVISEGTFENQIYEMNGFSKDGEEVPLEASITQWQGETGPVFAAIIRDVSERKMAEVKLKNSLDEKNILLMEIHHRVKNHLQIISSMINLLSLSLEDKKTKNILLEIQNRVRTIARIHEILYKSKDLSRIEMNNYVASILKNLHQTYKTGTKNIEINSDIGEIYLNMETATPCGLIINELVTNSLKYAFPQNQGKIIVTLREKEGIFELTISDNGVGIPNDISMSSTKTLGLRLVNNLVRQIKGEIILNRVSGTEFKILFKEAEYEDRI